MKCFFVLLSIIFAYGEIGTIYAKKPNETDKKEQKPLVVCEKISKGNLPVYIKALGNVTSQASVLIKPQISGILTQIHFNDGQDVKKNQLLAEIDARPFEAQLKQYEGQYERDKALLENAKLDLERYKDLNTKDSISKQILDTQIALVKQYVGIVKSDQGLIDTVRVNLNYCKIKSPIEGKIGIRLVDPGNFVQISDVAGIALVNATNKVRVYFTIPEDEIPRLQKKTNQSEPLIVEAYDRWHNNLLKKGVVETIDNQIDVTTGTIKIKSIFENNDNILFPNQFVNIHLLIHEHKDVLLAPTRAIQLGSKGNYVYVLNDNQTISLKMVEILGQYQNNSAVKGDLNENQSVVVEGGDKLKEGMEVTLSGDEQKDPSSKPKKDKKKDKKV
ncbi:MAG: efflux RND transporter periplasmic adaptor subunit [Alphaproteobacteria bacterium]|nr:efflux RND transporter periplasmic adaptor subunit [Alphaproteobacteria bacterium]